MAHWMDNWLEKSEENNKRRAKEDAEIAALYVEREPNPVISPEQEQASAEIALWVAQICSEQQRH